MVEMMESPLTFRVYGSPFDPDHVIQWPEPYYPYQTPDQKPMAEILEDWKKIERDLDKVFCGEKVLR